MTVDENKISNILAELSLTDKANVVTGHGMWTTRIIGDAGIPALTVTDGPNGARGAVLSRSLSLKP